MRHRLDLAIAAMATCAILAGDAAVAQPTEPARTQAPDERPPAEEPQLTGTGGVGRSPHSASAYSADIDDQPVVAPRSYRMTCQVRVGSCSIAADGPGQSCFCNAKGHPDRYWGQTVAP